MSLKIWLPLNGTLNNLGSMSNEITATNVTISNSGKLGKCYTLAGTNNNPSYIKLATPVFDNNATQFSYCAWVYPTSSETACLFSNRNDVSSWGLSVFINSTGNILFDSGSRLTISYPIPLNTWTHIAFTWVKNGARYVYVNGVQVGGESSHTSTLTGATTSASYIGTSQDSATTVKANWLNGKIYDVRIFDNALSATEVKDIYSEYGTSHGLKVWIPCTDNTGTGDATVRNLGTAKNRILRKNITYADGLMGSCYGFSSSGASLYCEGDIGVDCNHISACCWVKVDSAPSSSSFIFCLNNNGDSTDQTISAYVQTTGNLKVFGNTVEVPTIVVGNYGYELGKWFHLAVTSENGVTKVYINGAFCATSTSSTVLQRQHLTIGARSSSVDQTTFSYRLLTGYINDFRFYDYVLSPTEIKEISKGLVRHYKLNGAYGGARENLYTGSRNFSGTWINSGDWTTASEKYKNFTVKTRSIAWSGLTQNVPCTQGDKLTISFYGKVASGGTIRSIITSNLGETGDGIVLRTGNFSTVGSTFWVKETDDGTHWKRYWGTVEITGSNITYLQWRIENGIADKQFWFCGVKMEKGSTPTPWTPAPTDIGINTTFVPDSSGYRHRGTIEGTLALSENSARNMSCALFNGTNTAITATSLSTVKSVSFWLKLPDLTVGKCVFADTLSHLAFALSTSNHITVCTYAQSIYHQTYLLNNLVANKWQHFVVQWNADSSDVDLYVDGVVANKNVGSQNMYQQDTTAGLTIGARQLNGALNNFMTGSMSDFRAYVTRLSEADISTLYNTTSRFYKNNTLGSYTFNEDDKVSISKTGVFTSNQICELQEFSYLKYDRNIYFEPDGSAWVHVFHHNVPSTGVFSQSLDFVNSVYLDENRWFNMDVCNYVSSFEFLIVQKATSDSAVERYRWIQPTNPMSTGDVTFVSHTDLIKLYTSNEGYNDLGSAYGGIWKSTYGMTYLCQNKDDTTSSWWGAIGAYRYSSTGGNNLPGFNGVYVTTGCIDVYLRVDVSNLICKTIPSASVNTSGVVEANASYNICVASVRYGAMYEITGNTDTSGSVVAFFTSMPAVGGTSYNSAITSQDIKTFTSPVNGYVALRTSATDKNVCIKQILDMPNTAIKKSQALLSKQFIEF